MGRREQREGWSLWVSCGVCVCVGVRVNVSTWCSYRVCGFVWG